MGLTEVEKKLLLLCQSQTSLSTNETKDENQTSSSQNDIRTSDEENLTSSHAANDDTSLTDAERMLLVMCQKEKSENKMENENIVDNVATKIEEKESSTAVNSNETSEDTVAPKVEDCNVVTETKNLDHELGNRNLSQDIKESETAVITVDALDTIEVVEPNDSINIKHEHNVDVEEFDLKEVTKDLKQTENVLDKRANVVDKVNKVLDSKLRKADFVQKQRDECLAFDISHKNLISTEKENSDQIEIENEKKDDDQSITQDEDDQEPKKCDDETSLNETHSSSAKINIEQENQNQSNAEEETLNDPIDSQL